MKDAHHFRFTPSVWIVPTVLLLLMWGVFFVERRLHIDLGSYGIVPRTISGLRGVLFSPFLHGSLSHIGNNSVSFFILTVALIYFYRNLSLKVLLYGIFFSGILTWIIGRDSYHIGASGLIYVLVSFIFFKGMMTGYYRLMALSFAVVLIYGGTIWYIFPEIDKTISWEAHLSGLITGFLFALFYETPDYKKSIMYEWEQPDFDPMSDPFMKRFDENGNFVNLPKPEDIEVEADVVSTTAPVNYVYTYKESKNRD